MKRMRSWWLAAAVCAVLAAALLLPQRFLQQKLDRVAETEFSVAGYGGSGDSDGTAPPCRRR